MKEEYISNYVLENGKLKKMRVKKSEAFKDIDFILKRDKEFLEIMEKL